MSVVKYKYILCTVQCTITGLCCFTAFPVAYCIATSIPNISVFTAS